MSRGRGGHRFLEAFDPIDDFVISLLPPQEAAALSEEQLEVLRANLRSEILFSEPIRKALAEKARQVVSAFRPNK